MRRGPLAGFLVTEFTAILALPLGYGLAGGSCAPPGISCYRPGVLCPAVCTDAWAQFPTVAAFGAALGVAPAILVALLILGIERRKGMGWTASRSIALPAMGSLGLLGTLLLVTLIFPYLSGSTLALVLAFGLAVAVASGGTVVVVERRLPV